MLLGPGFACGDVGPVHDGTDFPPAGRAPVRSRREPARDPHAVDRPHADLMRFLYSAAWWLALPLGLGRLWWRGRKEPGYRQHLAERLGFYEKPGTPSPLIWVHAVSVGETRAAEPLVDALLQAWPSHAILLT